MILLSSVTEHLVLIAALILVLILMLCLARVAYGGQGDRFYAIYSARLTAAAFLKTVGGTYEC